MQLGLFSISYGGLWGQSALDLRAFVRRAASLGYDAVMLAGKRPHLSPLDTNADAVAAAPRRVAHTANVKCPVVAAYTDLTPASAAEVPFIEMQIAYVESLCKIGAQLGASVVRIFTAYEQPGQSPYTRTTGNALSARFARCATAPRLTASRSRSRIITTSGFTPPRYSNCCTTSTSRTASSDSMRGRRPSAARICMKRRSGRLRTRRSPRTRTTSGCRASSTDRIW